ncbi:unnamed protein product [Arabidopsis thaliana]|uniref:(thale cress) hypothetical protein n=1 Tax=Arabidopsis thaliana TaxID=3702 RepID=A0A7G2EFS3_ARATH|nr:unnamed protein product [Arabidopsis thaliana]
MFSLLRRRSLVSSGDFLTFPMKKESGAIPEDTNDNNQQKFSDLTSAPAS